MYVINIKLLTFVTENHNIEVLLVSGYFDETPHDSGLDAHADIFGLLDPHAPKCRITHDTGKKKTGQG